MKRIKDGKIVDSVIIQEGVVSKETFNDCVAEPLIYFIGNAPACYLYRYHSVKDKFSNLNSVGCHFIDISSREQQDEMLSWNIVSKIAVLAVAVEMCDIFFKLDN
ncbi:MAG: glutamate--cysteine ligase [Ehrlichia sp.]